MVITVIITTTTNPTQWLTWQEHRKAKASPYMIKTSKLPLYPYKLGGIRMMIVNESILPSRDGRPPVATKQI